jgi:hypothetical protein
VLNHIARENGWYSVRKSAENNTMNDMTTDMYLRDTRNLGISLVAIGSYVVTFDDKGRKKT